LLRALPQIPGEARPADLESGMRSKSVGEPRAVAQAGGLTALGAVVDRVERQEGVRQHVCLHGQVLSPDLAILGRELISLEHELTVCARVADTPIKENFPIIDAWLIV
jgi:hypothetical protein